MMKKFTEWVFKPKTQGSMVAAGDSSQNQIPVPKDAYLSYQGVPLSNIRPYTDTEISQAENVQDWANAYL